jgi:hypothetical protein
MLIFMGVRKGLQKLKGHKDQSTTESEHHSKNGSKPSQLAGTQEVARRSTESVNEDGTPKEVKKA